MTAEDTEWLAGARALLAKQLPLGHEVSLHYALGKYFDDVGRYDEAFGHYRQANELTKRVGSSYDGARLTQRVDAIIANLDAAFLKRCGAVGSATEVPVFIIGMPRSGTSLTEQILASHPDVFGAGEVTFWDAAFLAYQNAGLAGDITYSPARANLISSMAHDYLERLTNASGGALRVVDKMPGNFLYAGLIHAAFPRARIIHMKRHPIDTCLSIYFQNFFNMDPYANDLDNLGHYYREYLRITDHWRAVLPATALLEVPYEALIEDQEGCTRRMLDFVGLPWDPKCLDFHQTASGRCGRRSMPRRPGAGATTRNTWSRCGGSWAFPLRINGRARRCRRAGRPPPRHRPPPLCAEKTPPTERPARCR
jgi:tetratricopeptide (TPR) repeat protein